MDPQVGDIQERLESHLWLTLSAQGWDVSRFAYDFFPGADSEHFEDRTFAVGILPGAGIDPLDRQKVAVGLKAQTNVSVRWTAKVRADDQVNDYRRALTLEVELVKAIKAIQKDPGLVPRFTGFPVRSVVANGTVFFGQVDLTFLHRYALQ